MTEARAWVLLRSKRRLDLLNPTPFDWDLAEGEACTFRWGGSSVWDWPICCMTGRNRPPYAEAY